MKIVKRIMFVLLFIFLISSVSKSILDYRNKLEFYNSYKKDYEDAKKRNTTLKTEILKKSDPQELEKTIRNQLNLLREDEIDVILPPPSPTPTILIPTPQPNWSKWQNIFFGS